jgi:putative ATP-binding cassette transporter
MNVLTSLFPLVEGSIYLNGRVLTDGEIQGYRDLFSTIFTDFHLFDRLYGVENYDQEEADALIRAMEIDHVTSICDKQITNRNLSTGQKKRLALALTRIEDKPIFIFDEWAADQEPQFRKYFYNEIIPELKRKGKTIVAVTHDDHYFSAADRIIKLEFGRVVPFQP